jgi:hypothetical protein
MYLYSKILLPVYCRLQTTTSVQITLSDGHLTTLWVSRESMTIADDEVLFTLRFRALRNGTVLRKYLRPSSALTVAEAYNFDGELMKIDFEFTERGTLDNKATFHAVSKPAQPVQYHDDHRIPPAGKQPGSVTGVQCIWSVGSYGCRQL